MDYRIVTSHIAIPLSSLLSREQQRTERFRVHFTKTIVGPKTSGKSVFRYKIQVALLGLPELNNDGLTMARSRCIQCMPHSDVDCSYEAIPAAASKAEGNGVGRFIAC
jgi:hypothetical protein